MRGAFAFLAALLTLGGGMLVVVEGIRGNPSLRVKLATTLLLLALFVASALLAASYPSPVGGLDYSSSLHAP